jgi:hypothetical protein
MIAVLLLTILLVIDIMVGSKFCSDGIETTSSQEEVSDGTKM